MENEIFEKIEELLLADAAFTAEFGVGDDCRLYAGVAPKDAAVPFAVYRVDETEMVSKDGAGMYSVEIALVFPSDRYKGCVAMKNTVKNVLDNENAPFSYQNSVTDYEESMGLYVSQVNFTVTIRN